MKLNEWLKTELGQQIWVNKYQHNGESLDSFFDRVAGGNEHIKKLIMERKFLPAGRTLANRGIKDKKGTYSNCYFIKAPEDNIEDIFRCGMEIARTLSYGGGAGTDISKLSPVGARVNNAAKTTSGAVSFMDFFSFITGMIAQNGRRGALMLTLECTHPDLIDFIHIKQNDDRVTKANISIKITDAFMKAVEEDEIWEMTFTRPETGETITRTARAKDIFRMIAESNHMWAEPGFLFWDNVRNWHMLTHNKDYVIGGTNPCSEQPLTDYGSCNLASINLSEYVINPFTPKAKFNFKEFEKDVYNIVIYMNELLEENMELHPLPQQKEVTNKWKPIGLGVMGFADMLIKMGIPYNQKAISVINKIAKAMFSSALDSSINLSYENGTYENFTMDGFKDNEFNFINRNLSVEQLVALKTLGMRNATLLTIAPTGTLSNMLGVGGGIEPLFDTSYIRKTETLHGEDTYYKIYQPIVEEYIQNGGKEEDILTAKTIPYEDRIRIQAQWQRYVDTAISSTVNLPESATVEDVEDILMLAWKNGLKGITIYRENCGRGAILTSEKEKCPECGGEIKNENGCKSCLECGWGACSL